jgi:CRP-like cAMP-binding protein
LSDGRRQIESFHLPGDFFGFESGPTYRLTSEAIVDTVMVIFDRRALERFATRDVRTARQLWKLAVREFDHAVDHMLLLGRKTALERVSDFLLEMGARMRATGGTELPMQRRDIADYLGLTVETVSRMISRLETEGVIERLDRSRCSRPSRSTRCSMSCQALQSRGIISTAWLVLAIPSPTPEGDSVEMGSTPFRVRRQ